MVVRLKRPFKPPPNFVTLFGHLAIIWHIFHLPVKNIMDLGTGYHKVPYYSLFIFTVNPDAECLALYKPMET